MTKATIEISEEDYQAILDEQYRRRKKGEKLTIAQVASYFLSLGVRSVSGDTVKAK